MKHLLSTLISRFRDIKSRIFYRNSKILSENKRQKLSQKKLLKNNPLSFFEKIRKNSGIRGNQNPNFIRSKFLNQNNGYVAILLVFFVPVIMLGTKWALDVMTMHDTMINARTSGPLYRDCAEFAAKAVAQNWNPGKSLDHQKRAVLKIADQVYNDGINTIGDAPELAKAVPGIQLSVNDKVILSKGFDPIVVKKKVIPTDISQINYKSATKYLVKRQILQKEVPASLRWNLPFVTWKVVDKLSSLTTTYDKFDEIDQEARKSGNYVLNRFDRFYYPHQRYVRSSTGYPNRTILLPYTSAGLDADIIIVSDTTENTNDSGYTDQFGKNITESNATCTIYNSQNNGTYTYREKEDDDRVQVSVEDDKIKVVADNKTAYAVPEECNVDIVLACPTNGATTNKNNRDQNSTTPEMPYLDTENGTILGTRTEPPADVKACPIYQIGQAFRDFAKEFYHKKGVSMALIPYSGKVSLDPDVADGYTKNWNNWNSFFNFNPNNFLNNQNTYQAYIRGRALYGSYGLTDKELNNGYSWNTLLTACPIFCRVGLHFDGGVDTGAICNKCGANHMHTGDILSNMDPTILSEHYAGYFYRQNSNPCYGGYADLLTMRCEKNCTTYLPNPYYIIEPTADVQKIYEICGALYPFYDEYNVSNFLFIPITWANNLWQSWTRDPGCSAVDTDASGNGGRLSVPSKMTAGRKKVLVLVVNKPDWFEPHELTYVGFDNDFSEIPMIESDRIDFSQDYSDMSKKFADGTAYNGTIQGPKKILKVSAQSGVSRNADSGYYECESGSLTLSFPKKYLVKVVVESLDKITWERKSCNLSSISSNAWRNMGKIAVGPINGKTQLLAHTSLRQLACSTDGITWTNLGQEEKEGWYLGPVYGNGVFVIINYMNRDNNIQYSSNATSWTGITLKEAGNSDSLTFGNSVFMTFGSGKVYTSADGKNWTAVSSLGGNHRVSIYGAGMWLCGQNNTFYRSYNNGITWENINADLNKINSNSEWYGGAYARGHFYATNYVVPILACSKNGEHWETAYSFDGCTNSHRNVTMYNNKMYIFSQQGTCCHIGTFLNSSITFSNLKNKTNISDGSIEERREFYIEPSQIADDCTVSFNMKNVRLISAEITNRPYTKSGTTFTWAKIRLPEMSRWIDISKNPYEANLCVLSSNFTSAWSYNGSFWVNKNANGYHTQLFYDNYAGDHISISYSDNTYTMWHYCRDGLIDAGANRMADEYPISGLSKTYTPFNRFCIGELSRKEKYNDYNNGAPGTINLIMQTMTLPINTALYWAYYDGAVHEGEWYKDKSGNYDYDASNAAKNATVAACRKLKKDFGENLRIYLIKYRKQTQYKHKITSAVTNFDYNYLNECTENIYDISTEDELKKTVKTIADNVKSWSKN